jgi:hypothetical protein
VTAAADDLGERRRRIARQLATQAGWCRRLGSPLYGALLERAAADCDSGGATWTILAPQAQEALAQAVALRFMGAVHRLVLQGEAESLARHYPSAGGEVGDLDDAWHAFRQTLARHQVRLVDLSRAPVQTNEVGRCAALLGGFLEVARRTGLPLRLLEIGAAAGLNLRWDRYRYETGAAAWGDAAAAVRFAPAFEGAHPSFDVQVEVVERRGCDPRPLDPASEADRTTLRAYLWPDQNARRRRLDGALQIAQVVPARIEAAAAGDWLALALAQRRAGAATVVFQSIVMQYVAAAERARIADTLRDAGARATADAPLAYLRFEPTPRDDGEWIYGVDLTLWPGGAAATLAVSSPHGPPVKWLGARLRARGPRHARDDSA